MGVVSLVLEVVQKIHGRKSLRNWYFQFYKFMFCSTEPKMLFPNKYYQCNHVEGNVHSI